MTILYHNNGLVSNEPASEFSGMRMPDALLRAADSRPDDIIAWCDVRLKDFLDASALPGLLHHKRLLFSYDTSGATFLGANIGFCEESTPYIPVKFNVQYPTWQMSDQVGAIHAEALNVFAPHHFATDNFAYFLNSFAKRAMRSGLFCYSQPKLLKEGFPIIKSKKASIFELFRFVREHYRMRWTSLLLLDLLIYKRRFALLPYLFSVFHAKRDNPKEVYSKIALSSSKNIVDSGTIDVIIPTIGRREHFHNVMKDLAQQTHLPKRVIVVEQDADPNSVSELDFLKTEKWPFEIDHIFTHRTGACAARNVALMRTNSDFVFMADDDIRFNATLIEDAFRYFKMTGNEVLQAAGPQPSEKIKETAIVQHPVLGSGWVFLKQKCLDGIWFSPGFEFGYGEDKDFGIQLRNKGYDILLVPFIHVLHLKAPMGGFRVKPPFPWEKEAIQPKPSPTIMLLMRRNFTKEQIMGYKIVHFFKAYGLFSYPEFRKRWKKSTFWASELARK